MRYQAMLGLLFAATATNGWSQTKPPCSLLTATDVSGAGASGQGIASSMNYPDGTPKGGVMQMCNWPMTTGGAIMMSVAPMRQGFSRDAIMTMLNQSWHELTTKGWIEEKQDFGGISCFLMTPPATEKGAPMPTSCTAFVKGTVMSIVSMGKVKVPMETVKKLVESATGRL
jgi:hypothetical protein